MSRNRNRERKRRVIKLDFKASEAEASRLYELNLLAFVPNKFDFWGPKCPNYLNIEF